MTPSAELHPLLQGINKRDYEIRGLDDEIRVDSLCIDLLRHLYRDLTVQGGQSPHQAGESCHGADYFLREFLVADRRRNLFATKAADIRQFAGHWYIICTNEPNLTELRGILQGTEEFFRFLGRQGLITAGVVDEIAAQCRDLDYYQQRIDDFWAIEGDGYDAWRQACPLPPAIDRP